MPGSGLSVNKSTMVPVIIELLGHEDEKCHSKNHAKCDIANVASAVKEKW